MGDWTDAVYLSTDGIWDINDPLLGTVDHTGGLAQGEVYAGSLNTVIPGTPPGDYHILVRSDVTNQEGETDEANNVVASPPLTLSFHTLVANGPASSGTLSPSDNVDLYALHVNGGDNVGLGLDGLTTSAVNELYASFEAIPTRLSYDFRSVKDETVVNRQNQMLTFTAPPGGGTLYVLVYGDQIDASGSSPYRLSATTGPFVVTSITPDQNTNRIDPEPGPGFLRTSPYDGRVVPGLVTVSGAGFSDGTTVEFIGSDGSIRLPASTQFVSSSTLVLNLDLPNWPADVYDVRITKGSTIYTSPHAFTVVAGGAPQLETNIIVPDTLSYLYPTKQTIWVEYANTGDAAMPAPLLTIHVDFDGLITADPTLAIPFSGIGGEPAGVTDTVQVMAAGSGATPGILEPGDSGRIPIYWIGLGKNHDHPAVTVSLSTLTADDVTWTRPPQVTAAGALAR